MTTPPRLRDARPADLNALLALEAMFPGDRMSARGFRHQLSGRGAGRLRVLVGGDRLLGYALLLLPEGARVARLYSIAVDPAERGRGHGARLLADAERLAAAAGRVSLRLEVRATNRRALRLYRNAGYRELLRLPGYYQDGRDGLRLEKPLPPARGAAALRVGKSGAPAGD